MLAERGPARAGLMVVTVLLGLLMLAQCVLARLRPGSAGPGEAAALGAIMAVPWLLSAVLVVPAPKFAAALLCLAGIVGVVDQTMPLDVRVWGGIAFLLALLCLGAWLADSRATTSVATATATVAPPGPVARPAAPSATDQRPLPAPTVAAEPACPACGAANTPTARFCHACGAPMLPIA